MRYSYLDLPILLGLWTCAMSLPAHAQTTGFLDKSDSVLKEFLTKHFAHDAPGGYSIVDGPSGREGVPNKVMVDGVAIEPNMAVLGLVNRKDWAVEMVLQKIEEIRSRPKYEYFDVFRFVSFIVDSNRPDTLEIISTRLKDDPDYPDFISSALTHSTSSRYPEAPRMWYRALESSDPTVVSVAVPILSEIFADPPHDFRRLWAIGLVDRYGHSPTALEMATDPIFKAAQERNPEKAAQTRAVMIGLTEKEYLRRQLPAPVVVRE